MTSRNLTRRLERLEDRLPPATEEPVVFVIAAVSSDGQIVYRFRLTPAGSRDSVLPAPASRRIAKSAIPIPERAIRWASWRDPSTFYRGILFSGE